eukprot:bmy_21613T0
MEGGRRYQAGEARGGGVHPVRSNLLQGPGGGEDRGGGHPGQRGAAGRGSQAVGVQKAWAAARSCRRPLGPAAGPLDDQAPAGPRLRRTRPRRLRGHGRSRRMEEWKEEGEAEIQEHERQCLAEDEQDEQLPPELQEEAAAAAQPEHKQQKL